MGKHKQSATCAKHVKYTTDELLSIFKEEAQLICKNYDESHSIVESVLKDFIKRYDKYVRFVSKHRYEFYIGTGQDKGKNSNTA